MNKVIFDLVENLLKCFKLVVSKMAMGLWSNNYTSKNYVRVDFTVLLAHNFSCQTVSHPLVCLYEFPEYNSLLNQSTMLLQGKRLGKGSVCSVCIKNLQPKNLVTQSFPNTTTQDFINDLIAVKKASTQQLQRCIIKNIIYF